MSGADYFSDQFAINAYMDSSQPVDVSKALAEHSAISNSLKQAGIKIIKVDAPKDCQDGVYTANWALCRGNKALLSALPNKRQPETPYAESVLKALGKNILRLPKEIRFSGQGDALPCGNLLFVGSQYRTDEIAHKYINEMLGYEVISLQTVPKRTFWGLGSRYINPITKWPDSFFYDIDLALSVLSPDLIAYCPEAFIPKSRNKIASLPVRKIIVDIKEAKNGFACNLVSTGKTVVMSSQAPKLKKAIEAEGLKTITPEISELGKGGGYIRCTTLTLDNI